MTADYSPANPLVPPAEVAAWIESTAQPVALTDGTGFVGSHLVDTLCSAGLRPRLLVRDADNPRWIGGVDAEWIEGSLEDTESLKRLVDGVGTVIHLAGVLRAGRESEFDTGNRLGTANLVTAIKSVAPDARVVHVSSLAATGPSPEPEGRAPGDPAAPISAYGRSKLAGEAEVAALGKDHWWCILRPPAVYGPRDTDIFEFFKMASLGLAAIPAGERWLTMAYVADVVRAVLAAANLDTPRGIYHLGEPAPQLLDDIFDQLAEGGRRRVRIVRLPSAMVRVAGSAGSLLRKLGWSRLPLTRDKAKELLASHWTAQTTSSLDALGVGTGTLFAQGAEATWQWYRSKGWVR